jgi:hypothetical protein
MKVFLKIFLIICGIGFAVFVGVIVMIMAVQRHNNRKFDWNYLALNIAMHFTIALTVDTRAGIKSHILTNLSIYLKKSFEDKDYGADLLKYTLGFTSVLAPEGYGHFFEKKKPIYVSDRMTKNKFTGEKYHMFKLFINSIVIEPDEYEDFVMFKLFINSIVIEPDEYEDFVSGTDLHSLAMVKAKILASLSNLDQLPKKVKDFDKERFRLDMKNLLEQADDLHITSFQP